MRTKLTKDNFMDFILDVGTNKINGRDIFFFILATCFIAQTLGEIFRGERSLLTGSVFLLVSFLAIVSPFIFTNVDKKTVDQVNQEKYVLDCEPESKSKTSNLFFITCKNSKIIRVDSYTYQYYKDLINIEPTKLMKFENLIIYIFKIFDAIFIPFIVLIFIYNLFCIFNKKI